MKKGLHKSKKVCYDNPRWETGVIFGPVAQLGERTVRIRKVESSILFVSTMPFGARQNRSRLAAAGLLFLLMYFNCTRTLPRKPPRRKYRDAKYISQTIFPLDICRKKML